MKVLDFLAFELSTTPDELRSRCKNKEIVEKRWTVMCFYRLMGLTISRIGVIMFLNHQTVLHGLKRADESIHIKAQKLYDKFTKKKNKRTKIIKVPDYHTCKIITKEIEI